MRRLALAFVLLLGPLALAPLLVRAQDCIDVQGSARWVAYGYNHYVRVQNNCERDQRCQVATSVNPTVVEVDVDAGQSVEVMTQRGSPAREFTPRVECVPR